jgi:hypothetical protein
MSVLNENTIIGASAAGEYEIEQSIRFDDGRGTYLSRTTDTWTDGKKYTLSMWVKRATLSTDQQLLTNDKTSSGNTGFTFLKFDTNNKLYMYFHSSAGSSDWYSDAVFRDTSAWYHIVHIFDSANSTAADRGQVYVNGTRLTSAAGFDTAIPVNFVPEFTESPSMFLGINGAEGSYNQVFDGYLAEVNFIDGQALTPDNFGETGDYGEWKPIEYAGTYGNNGFYLPFKQDYAVEGFSTVTYEGNGTSQYVGGVGFSPSLTWFKRRSGADYHTMYDVVRGATKSLSSNLTGAEVTRANSLTGFSTDGFVLGNDGITNADNQTFVAWNWDMGGTTASNTSGSITSSVRANTTYGQSIVKWTSTGGANTIGHGLSQAPDMIIAKPTNDTDQWVVYTSALGNTKMMGLNYTTAETTNSIFWNNTTPSSSVFTTGSWFAARQFIAYCFHSVTGYSSFGSYSGTGSSGNAITTGFAPAFVMVKRTDVANNWYMFDNTRNPSGQIVESWVIADGSNAEADNTFGTFDSNGFTVNGTSGGWNASGGTYIYMAFADTREYAYWYDQSGNNNDWTSEGGLTESDVMVDSPTNNFCTMNPLRKLGAVTYSQGNCISALPAGDNTNGAVGTFAPSSGKWYWEATSTHTPTSFGIADSAAAQSILKYSGVGMTNYYLHTGIKWVSGVNSAYGSSGSAGDIIGTALDMDNRTIQFFKNGSSLGAAFTIAAGANMAPACFGANVNNVKTVRWNFGADSSFAGNKTPQGNQDSNGIGDFYYAPPTGFLALCTANLPEPDVIPSEHFNPVLWAGNGSVRSITGVGFAPDLVWGKSRSYAYNNIINDRVRGAGERLFTNTTGAESNSTDAISSLDSDGFGLGVDAALNASGQTYVAWNWKAGGSAVSNTNGTITSSVSANPSAGFSIVSYTGSGSAGTVGHGLSKIPDMIITKGRSNSGNWVTWQKDLTGAFDFNGGYAYLNSTGAAATTTVFYDGTGFTSSVFKWRGGNENVNQSSRTYLSYCFHSVESYSKVGSYTGNGSATDGTFVHCGFKPAWVMWKRTDAAQEWHVFDTTRDEYNPLNRDLWPPHSSAEYTGYGGPVDYLSNGFKFRTSSVIANASGGTYIFIAFAENPFKHTNAR